MKDDVATFKHAVDSQSYFCNSYYYSYSYVAAAAWLIFAHQLGYKCKIDYILYRQTKHVSITKDKYLTSYTYDMYIATDLA